MNTMPPNYKKILSPLLMGSFVMLVTDHYKTYGGVGDGFRSTKKNIRAREN